MTQPDLGSRCADCALPYGDPAFPDMLIPTYAWLLIMGHEGGLLCPNCIVARLEGENMFNVPHWFASGPLHVTCSEPAWLLKERLLRLEELVERAGIGRPTETVTGEGDD